ncbi:hypothetical protein PAXRUDRAFT_19288 [Paxillus rubicundulus Ve08.2h10]|uniref:Major facilitator superfamily (MFS) profile domain-containing protein n=1 Tax=Paxillus rubicundulus Ve08.2h10 TaxID=930991 RepID=A0A0D0D502_9AGAM|nr:hypothetical protein PAXRUDRAFT_19288 [Paxillus rubicundulus Ve08.2h10]
MAVSLARFIHKELKARRQAQARAAQDIDSDAPTLPSYETTGNVPHIPKNGTDTICPDNTADQQQPSPAARSTFWFKVRLMCALLLPVFLETLDYTVVATAQPHIASVFNALSLQSYIGTAYLLSSTVFLPLFASVADVFGRYPGLQISLFFFLIGSAISTGAINITMMLLGRGIAGVGAAGLLTVRFKIDCQ